MGDVLAADDLASDVLAADDLGFLRRGMLSSERAKQSTNVLQSPTKIEPRCRPKVNPKFSFMTTDFRRPDLMSPHFNFA